MLSCEWTSLPPLPPPRGPGVIIAEEELLTPPLPHGLRSDEPKPNLGVAAGDDHRTRAAAAAAAVVVVAAAVVADLLAEKR